MSDKENRAKFSKAADAEAGCSISAGSEDSRSLTASGRRAVEKRAGKSEAGRPGEVIAAGPGAKKLRAREAGAV